MADEYLLSQSAANIDAGINKAIPQTDWVIESGSTPIYKGSGSSDVVGLWYYQKWNSGLAECWGEGIINDVWQRWSDTLYFLEGKFTFPSNLFISAPTVLFAPNISQASSASCWSGFYTRTLSKDEVARALYRPNSGSNNENYYVSLIVKGRWK